jgi:hypothetical protein
MKATEIKLQDLKIGDEVIVIWYEYGHMHGIIKELMEIKKLSNHQFNRFICINLGASDAIYNVCNTDNIYLIHRPKK